MVAYSPDDQEGWTAPKEHGFSVETNHSEEDIESPFEENNPSDVSNDALEGDSSRQDDDRSDNKTRKKKNTFQKRIDQLVYEKGEMEQSNSFLSHQLAEKEAYLAQQQARLQEYEKQIEIKDKSTNQYFEHSLNTQESSLKQKIRQAKEEGDVDSEIELIDQLAELKATKTTHAAWKIQEEQRKYNELQSEDYIPYETKVENPYQRQTSQNFEFQEWLEDNQWYNEPNLQNEADTLADDFAKILKFNNKAHLIGTGSFFDEITKAMNQRYGVADNSQPQEQQDDEEEEYYPPRPAVAPVTRRAVGQTMAEKYVKDRPGDKNGMALNQLEFQHARHWIPRRGETEADLIKRYKRAKAELRSQGGPSNSYTVT